MVMSGAERRISGQNRSRRSPEIVRRDYREIVCRAVRRDLFLKGHLALATTVRLLREGSGLEAKHEQWFSTLIEELENVQATLLFGAGPAEAAFLRWRLELKHTQSARMVLKFAQVVDQLYSSDEIARALGSTSRAIKVYVSDIRAAFGRSGLSDPFITVPRLGYIFTASGANYIAVAMKEWDIDAVEGIRTGRHPTARG